MHTSRHLYPIEDETKISGQPSFSGTTPSVGGHPPKLAWAEQSTRYAMVIGSTAVIPSYRVKSCALNVRILAIPCILIAATRRASCVFLPETLYVVTSRLHSANRPPDSCSNGNKSTRISNSAIADSVDMPRPFAFPVGRVATAQNSMKF